MAATVEAVARDGLTALMVTHNMAHAIATGNRLVMMRAGRIIFEASGAEKAMLTRRGARRALPPDERPYGARHAVSILSAYLNLFPITLFQGLVFGLVALGIAIPFRFLAFPDLTAEGAVPVWRQRRGRGDRRRPRPGSGDPACYRRRRLRGARDPPPST